MVGSFTTDPSLEDYAVLWISPRTCEFYLFDLTSATTAEGRYAPSPATGQFSCGDISGVYPTTGIRTAAPNTFSPLIDPQRGTSDTSLVDALSEQLHQLVEEVR